ncbi:hypothetical protein [Streptomyces sp. RTGN2]|uniref:hypothetical protein n=1 Tax=Streptomyces sp. RTGN2 TaxID=3016525 RepID=UPI0025535AA8|nr:hypothetical protein [Streptomyces sp. RTGN2]
MNRQTPRSATALYAAAATCAAIGALLWLRSRTGTAPSLFLASSAPDTDGNHPSSWRVWSPVVSEERLGVYLLAVALVAARLVATWRE